MIGIDNRVVTVPPGVVLDLGATTKAVAADQCAAARPSRSPAAGVLVNLGGDIATAGTAPDGGWPVLVHDGEDEPAAFGRDAPPAAAMATSSTIRRRLTPRRRHVVPPCPRPADPGGPRDPVWRTVSVAAPSLAIAANTGSVPPRSSAGGLRRGLDPDARDIPARLVDRDRGGVHTSAGGPRTTRGGDDDRSKRSGRWAAAPGSRRSRSLTVSLALGIATRLQAVGSPALPRFAITDCPSLSAAGRAGNAAGRAARGAVIPDPYSQLRPSTSSVPFLGAHRPLLARAGDTGLRPARRA